MAISSVIKAQASLIAQQPQKSAKDEKKAKQAKDFYEDAHRNYRRRVNEGYSTYYGRYDYGYGNVTLVDRAARFGFTDMLMRVARDVHAPREERLRAIHHLVDKKVQAVAPEIMKNGRWEAHGNKTLRLVGYLNKLCTKDNFDEFSSFLLRTLENTEVNRRDYGNYPMFEIAVASTLSSIAKKFGVTTEMKMRIARLLVHKSWKVQAAASTIIDKLRLKGMEPGLIALFKGERADVRDSWIFAPINAVEALGALGSDTAVNALVDVLGRQVERSREVRDNSRRGWHTENYKVPLDGRLRAEAIRSLGRTGRKDVAGVLAVIAMPGSGFAGMRSEGGPDERIVAMKALANIGGDISEAVLTHIANDEKEGSRSIRIAIKLLGGFKGAVAVEGLKRVAIDYRDTELKLAAIASLEKIGTSKAKKALNDIWIATIEFQPSVAKQAERAMEKIEKKQKS